MKSAAAVTGMLVVLWGISARCEEVYVSPQGSDEAQGTKEQPLATLDRARAVVRQLKATAQGPITVLLRGGVYRLQEPVVFGPEDSGTKDCPITYAAYPGETPVISGGRIITGWKRESDELWSAQIPEVQQGSWIFHQLFVDGQRRPRARLPREGFYTVASPGDPPKSSFHFNPGEVDPNWRNLDDVEVVLLQYWTEARLRIASIDEASRQVRFTGDAFRPMDWSRGWFVENVAEGLTEPGQWYLDRHTGVLAYRPRPGERLGEVEVVAPVTRHWIRLEGDYEHNRWVENLVIRGLTWEHASWPRHEKLGYSYPQAAIELTPGELLWAGYPKEGLSTPQSQLEVPAAIYAVGARRVRFESNTISRTGAWGIDLALGCHENAIVGNHFQDMGAGAVRVGSPSTTFNTLEECRSTDITDNSFVDGCAVYLGSPAVWIGSSSGNRIAHNEIRGRWQWAISVGFQWGYMPPQNARDNLVEYNHCHHVVNDPLQTHAVIYLLGVQPGTRVRYNHVHHCPGAHGICLDNSSVGMVVEYNVVHHGQRGSLVFNYNDLGNIIQNNIFAMASDGQMFRSGDTGKLDQTGVFYRNIFYWKDDRLFNRSEWPNYDVVMDYNLYYDASGREVRFLAFSHDEWKQKGLDQNSLIADPLFVDPDNGDFSLRPETPARQLGFQPIDLSDVGPRGDAPSVQGK